MKKINLFLFCMVSLSMSLATDAPNARDSQTAPILAIEKPAVDVSEASLFVGKSLGHVLYLASATQQEEYVEVTINTAGYSFKPYKGFQGGKAIKVHLSPNNYKPLIIDGPLGQYDYTVKRVTTV